MMKKRNRLFKAIMLSVKEIFSTIVALILAGIILVPITILGTWMLGLISNFIDKVGINVNIIIILGVLLIVIAPVIENYNKLKDKEKEENSDEVQ